MLRNEIKRYYDREIAAIQALNLDEITQAVEVIKAAWEREATIYIFGNGGSATTASHYVGDFNKGISESLKKKFHLVCLNDNMASLLAIANDVSYDEVFSIPLRGHLKKDDLVIGISGSGNSTNVVNAVKYAKEVGAKVIGISGYSGGKLRELADYHMHVQLDDMQIVEDIHLTFDHMMYRVLTDELRQCENR